MLLLRILYDLKISSFQFIGYLIKTAKYQKVFSIWFRLENFQRKPLVEKMTVIDSFEDGNKLKEFSGI